MGPTNKERKIALTDLDRGGIAAVAHGVATVVLDDKALQCVEASWLKMEGLIAKGQRIYGINTGFGALGHAAIDAADRELGQRNLIYHLATGVGQALKWKEARALVAARLVVLSKGHSGCHPDVLTHLCAILNSDLAPWIPSKGTVGASGDLTPSAHMALALMGEGAFLTRSDERLSGEDGLQALDLPPLKLESRAALALVNGTSAMTGIACLNSEGLRSCLHWAVASASVYCDVMGARMEAYDDRLQSVRHHEGQIQIASELRLWLEDSKRVVQRPIADMRINATPTADDVGWRQDPYTLRCLPQAMGAVLDVLSWHNDVVAREAQAVTDNPVLAEDPPYALHGGNFFGQHIGFVSDALIAPVISLANIMDRQLARLVDANEMPGLPAMLSPEMPGLNSGFMGAQVTSSALLAEMRSQATPASMQSVPTNGNNQDINTMGTIAARKIASLLDDLASVIAIHGLAVAQAMDILGPTNGFSLRSQAFHDHIRLLSDKVNQDRPLFEDIARVQADILRGELQGWSLSIRGA